MNIKDFTNGWVVGDFLPSIIKTQDIGVGVLYLKAGEKGDGHYHMEHVEYNIILQGSAEKDGALLKTGDIFVYECGEKSFVEYKEDTILLVLKSPSVKNDKYF